MEETGRVPQHPRLRQDLILRELEAELVIYDPVTDRTALLNSTAAGVLELCDGTRTVPQLEDEIRRIFPGSATGIDDAIRDVLESLCDGGFLEGDGEPGS